MENTKIEWAHHTFNPWRGCQKVAPECDNCYAEAMDKRFFGGRNWGPLRVLPEDRSTGWRSLYSDANWQQPLRWARKARALGERHRVFCASLGDVLEDREELHEPRKRLCDLIHQTADALDWLLLTKRPQNAILIPSDIWERVWAGTSAGLQSTAEKNIPHLLKISAKKLFLSAEPLLGPVDVSIYLAHWDWPRLNWVICGGESGPEARAMHPDWARSLLNQCLAADVPFFFKQWGAYDHSGRRVGKKRAGRLLNGWEWNEVPG